MIPDKESMEVEFKSDRKCLSDNDLVETVVGFSNARGGSLYLGVEDTGEPTGIHANHRNYEMIVPMIANKTVPPVSVRADLLTERGHDIIVIEIPRSTSIISTSSGKTLKRVIRQDGTPETVPFFQYQFGSRLADLNRMDYSAEPVLNSTIDDLDPAETQRMRKLIRTFREEGYLLDLTDEELYKALRLTTDIEGRTYATVTGLLLIGREERIKALLPTASASFQVMEGTSVRINENVRKPILSTFEMFESYLKPWNPEREMDYGLLRFPIPAFDHSAFREALVNAFIHRDYTMLMPTRIQIDDDGLSITSPGGFVEGVSQDNLLTVEPHGRNPALSDALKRIGLAERTGRGIDRIFEGSILFGRPLPDYSESTSTYVRVFITKAKPDLGFVKMLADVRNREGKDLPIVSLMILSALRAERRCDIQRLAKLSMHSESRCKSAVERLVESGLVEALGSNRTRSYILSSKVYRDGKKSIEYVRQSGIDSVKNPEMVLRLVKEQGSIQREDVCKLLSISRPQAYRLLKSLTAQGLLTLSGHGRGALYVSSRK